MKTSVVTLCAWLTLLSASVVLSAGCAADDATGGGLGSPTPASGGSRNVSQGGAVDFAQFRAVVEAGGVPAPELLDEVGFFAEHAIALPPADCGDDLCVHPFLSVMPRFDDGNWTMAFVAMNTPVDPAELSRPPQHLVIAVDGSEHFPAELVREVRYDMLETLRPGDLITVATFGETVRFHSLAVDADSPDADFSFSGLGTQFAPVADLYQGLATVERAKRAAPDFEGHTRLLLLTSGMAPGGIAARERILGLASGIAEGETAISVIGYGEDYDASMGIAIGSLGGGTYAYAADPQELNDILVVAADTTLFPLATEFELTLEPGSGYRIGRIYGANQAYAHDARATLRIPALFIGRREGETDAAGGRRGGGGGLFVELIAEEGNTEGRNKPAFTFETTWNEKGDAKQAARSLQNPLAPGENPEGAWPYFSDDTLGKAYMMLNAYLALDAAVTFYADGDCSRALGVIDMMVPSMEGWLGREPDTDLEDDYALMLQLRGNIESSCQALHPQAEIVVIEPVSFDGGCGFL